MELKRLNRLCCCLGALVVTLAPSWGQEQYNRERYQLIVDRAPFGKEEIAAPTVNNDRVEQLGDQLEQQLRLSMLYKSDEDGEMYAGFQNLRPRPGESKSVTLRVGESFKSAKLMSIDLDDSSAMVEYMNNTIPLELSRPSQPQPAQRGRNTRTTRNTRTANTQTRRFGGGFTAPQPPQEPEVSEEEQARRLAEIRARLQVEQMDIIRKGQPPLPIQLTPEQDDQLVAEGILDPVE